MKICRICPPITGQYHILQNSAETEILQKQANSKARLKILHSAENCGPTYNIAISASVL